MNKIILLVIGCLALATGSASAQTVSNGRAVGGCGTPPYTYNPGAIVPFLIDTTTGLACVTFGGGGISIGTVNQGNAGTAGQAWFSQLTSGGTIVSSTNPIYTAPATTAYTDTVKSLTANTDTTLLAASATNKSVCLMNIGLNPATITNGASAAVVGNGQALSPAPAAGFQGGGYCYPLPPTNAIHAISTLGTTIIVTVGQ